MKTPRIEEKKGRKIGEDEYTEHWSLDGHSYIQVPKWVITQAHQAGIDEALEKVKKNIGDTIDAIAFKTMNEKRYFEGIENGLLHHSGRCMCKTCIEATRHAEMATIEEVAEALDDIIKALQDNK